MAAEQNEGEKRSADRTKTGQAVLVLLVVVGLGLTALVFSPFAAGLFLAAVLATALYPLHARLASKLGGRRRLSAGLLTAGSVLLLILPLTMVTVVAAQEISRGASYVQKTLEERGPEGLISDLPKPLRSAARKLRDLEPGQLPTPQTKSAARAVGKALSSASRAVIQTVLMLIALFFLLADGEHLIGWLCRASPLSDATTWEFLDEFRKVSRAVLISSVLTAAIQSAAALGGYLIAQVPHPFFFTVITFFVAFVPAVGAGGVVLAVAALQLLTGPWYWALVLAIWGVVVVGLADNLVKPLLIRGDVELHGAVIFFALLGGLAVFGLVGLIAGPLIVTFFLVAVRVAKRHAPGTARA